MNSFYEITEKIREYLLSLPSINTVRMGDPYELDNAKQEIFPVAHITPSIAEFPNNTIILPVSIIFADVNDQTPNEDKDEEVPFYGADNEQDILNTQLLNVSQLVRAMQSNRSIFKGMEDIDGTPSAEPFFADHENKLTGWVLTVRVVIRDNTTVCE